MGFLIMDLDNKVLNDIIEYLRNTFNEELSGLSKEELHKIIKDGFDNAYELEIYQRHNINRFIALRFLPESLIKSPFIQSVLLRVLNNFNLDETKRLNFIYKHIVNRNT